MALRSPSFVQLLRNADITSSSHQSLTLSLKRRNLAQKWWTVSRDCCFVLVRALMSGWVELDLNPDSIDDPESKVFPD